MNVDGPVCAGANQALQLAFEAHVRREECHTCDGVQAIDSSRDFQVLRTSRRQKPSQLVVTT